MVIQQRIEKVEAELKNAMLTSDVDALAGLLSDDLVFTDHMGHISGKDADIEAHRSGRVHISTIELSEMHVTTWGTVAVVCVKAAIEGEFNGKNAHGCFRFTRVWDISTDDYCVKVAHSCYVNE